MTPFQPPPPQPSRVSSVPVKHALDAPPALWSVKLLTSRAPRASRPKHSTAPQSPPPSPLSGLRDVPFPPLHLLPHPQKNKQPTAVPYLTDVKGFSLEVVTNVIFPVSIYASLAFYVVAGPLSHLLGTKTFVVLGALCKLATRMILIWGDSLGTMKLMQVGHVSLSRELHSQRMQENSAPCRPRGPPPSFRPRPTQPHSRADPSRFVVVPSFHQRVFVSLVSRLAGLARDKTTYRVVHACPLSMT